MIKITYDLTGSTENTFKIVVVGHSKDSLICCAISTLIDHYKTLSYIIGMDKVQVNEKETSSNYVELYLPVENYLAFKHHIDGIKKKYDADIETKTI